MFVTKPAAGRPGLLAALLCCGGGLLRRRWGWCVARWVRRSLGRCLAARRLTTRELLSGPGTNRGTHSAYTSPRSKLSQDKQW